MSATDNTEAWLINSADQAAEIEQLKAQNMAMSEALECADSWIADYPCRANGIIKKALASNPNTDKYRSMVAVVDAALVWANNEGKIQAGDEPLLRATDKLEQLQ